MCGKYFKRKHRIVKHVQIKHKHILVPGQRYQDSRNLLQNQKAPKNAMCFDNHAQRSNPPYYLDVDNPLRWNSKTQVVMKLKNPNCDKTQKLKMWQYSKSQIVNTQTVTKLKLWQNLKTWNVTNFTFWQNPKT